MTSLNSTRVSFADILHRHPATCIVRNPADEGPVGAGICVIAREPKPRKYWPLEVVDASNDVVGVAKNRLERRRAKGEHNVVAILFAVGDRRERSVLCYAIQDALQDVTRL